MAFINFLKPKNQLEEGGRTGAMIQQDPGEPEKPVLTATGRFLSLGIGLSIWSAPAA